MTTTPLDDPATRARIETRRAAVDAAPAPSGPSDPLGGGDA
jgi:hypothetical protein